MTASCQVQHTVAVTASSLHVPPTVTRALAKVPALESPVLAVALGLAAVTTALVTVLGRGHLPRGRWRRRGTVAGASVLTVLLLLLAGAVGLNAYVGYIPTLSSLAGGIPTVDTSGSRVLHVDWPAPALRVDDGSTYVYLPPGYDAAANAHRRYPVVYLYPGAPGASIDWFRAGQAQETLDLLIATRAIRPMVVVAPSTDNGLLVDLECANVTGGPQLETYLTSYLPARVDATFRTLARRSDRAVGGVSAGADCALDLALRHPREFAVVLAHLPSGEPGGQAFLAAYHGDRAAYLANAPIDFLPHHSLRRTGLAVYLDADTGTPADVRRARRLAGELRRAGAAVVLRVVPGFDHTWREARAELPYSLDFTSRELAGATPPASRPAALLAAQCRALRARLPNNTRIVPAELARERAWRAAHAPRPSGSWRGRPYPE